MPLDVQLLLKISSMQLDEIPKEYPDEEMPLYRAYLLRWEGNYHQAIQLLENLELQPHTDLSSFKDMLLSFLQFYTGRFQQFKQSFETLDEKMILAFQNPYLSSRYYHLKGLYHGVLEEYHVALEAYTKSIHYKEQMNDFCGIGYSLNNSAFVHYYKGDAQKGLKTLQMAQKQFEKANTPVGTGFILTNMAIVHSYLGNLETASELSSKGLELYSNKTVPPDFLANALQTSGKISIALGNVLAGLKALEQAYYIHKSSVNNIEEMVDICFDIVLHFARHNLKFHEWIDEMNTLNPTNKANLIKKQIAEALFKQTFGIIELVTSILEIESHLEEYHLLSAQTRYICLVLALELRIKLYLIHPDQSNQAKIRNHIQLLKLEGKRQSNQNIILNATLFEAIVTILSGNMDDGKPLLQKTLNMATQSKQHSLINKLKTDFQTILKETSKLEISPPTQEERNRQIAEYFEKVVQVLSIEKALISLKDK